jgi:diguanylate cyclase (GGDEF)-like protein/PAS domain S-box-containing protein
MSPDALNRMALLESVIAAVNLGAVVLDDRRRVVLWNRWMARHAGLDADAVRGRDLFEVFPELQNKRIESAVTQALRDNFPSLLSQTLNKAPFPLFHNAAARARDERMQQAVEVTPIDVAGEARHCLIQVSDVSIAVGREKLLREQALVLREQTYSDSLTGIANRRHFDVAMDKELRLAKRSGATLSLLMIDIDYFKSYNDHYGHQAGDTALTQVAAALRSLLQRPADLLARYGGEEFAAILPNTDPDQAVLMAEAIRARVTALRIPHVAAGGNVLHVTVSIGVASLRPDKRTDAVDDAARLIGAADRALYVAKRAGRDCVMVNPAQAN